VGSSWDETHWTVILGAAAGKPGAREEFARRYGSAVRAYLGARWRGTPLAGELDDAAQEVFVDCFKEGGALARVDPDHEGGFRAFLYGVVRNVARRFEQRRARSREVEDPEPPEPPASDDSPSRAFDRAWARTIMRLAREIQAANARRDGDEALRRVDLLRLRFEEGRTMRDIAADWGMDGRKLQYEYLKARQEFEAALHEAVRRHYPHAVAEGEAARLLDLLA
jgi:RNA polymerase sigma-70 factor (ECF subfamily)